MNRKQEFILRWAKRYRATQELGGKCTKCGEDDMFKLDFHHLDPNEKEYGISSISRHKPWEDIEKELNKCVLLCRNCHTSHHMGEIKLLFNKFFNEIYEKSLIVHEVTKSKLNDEYIYGMLKKGYSLNFIARSIKKDVSTIRDVAIRLEENFNETLFKRLNDHNKTKEKINDELLIKLYNDGVAVKDIAIMYKMNKSTLFPRIKKLKQNGKI